MNILQVLLIIFFVVFLIYYLLSNKEKFNNPMVLKSSSGFGYNFGSGEQCINYADGTSYCFQGKGSYESDYGSGYANFGYLSPDCAGGNCDQNILERRSQQFRRSPLFTTQEFTPVPEVDYGVNIVEN